MTNFATSVLRTLAQVLIGYAVTWLAAQGLDVPEQVQQWAMGAIVAGGIFLWTALIRWLETRKGDSFWPVTARRVGRVLMLGIGARPVYVPQDRQVEAVSDHRGTRTVTTSAAAGTGARP